MVGSVRVFANLRYRFKLHFLETVGNESDLRDTIRT
jgi:hypothetical protein